MEKKIKFAKLDTKKKKLRSLMVGPCGESFAKLFCHGRSLIEF